MPRRITEDDDYEFSESVESAIKLFWPDTMEPSDPRFNTNMMLLQIAMLKAQTYQMTSSDKRRALRTTIYLRNKLKGGDAPW